MADHADGIVAALAGRRLALAGEAEGLRARLAAIATDIGHLDAVIRQFAPDHPAGRVPGVAGASRPAEGAVRGRMSRAALSVLRGAPGPVSTAEVTAAVLAQEGASGWADRGTGVLAERLGMALLRQERRGTVAAERRPGRPILWRIAD